MSAMAAWEKAPGCEAYTSKTAAGFLGVAEQTDERWAAIVIPDGGRLRKRLNFLRFEAAQAWAESELA